MVDNINLENENTSDTEISVNLSGATIAVNNGDEENKSELSASDNDDSLTLPVFTSVIPPNSNLNIEQSSDVIVGPVTHFHGPVNIYPTSAHNNALSVSNESQKYLSNSGTPNDSVSPTFSLAQLVTTDTLPGKSYRRTRWSKKKIFFISFLTLLAIALILFSIFYSLGMYLSNENNKQSDYSSESDNNTDTRPQIPGSIHKLIYRDRWGGRKPLYERLQKVPVKYVIISHTAGRFCESVPDCSSQMVQMQSLHVADLGSPDIGYNFVIGGDDNIYVGRGWDNHNFHMNLDTIGICFMGNYIYNTLKPGMTEAANELMEMGIEKGKLDKDYIIVAHNQTYNTQSPGPNIYRQIKFWPHFSPEILVDIPDKS